ncbi:sigma-54-dependent transcriptional regulator [Blastopirellula marina]|uniref:Sigma-54-dependent Fis family transcriptional regulator n=1 Tax=Blastopirellula marina TaxID=124 RepID=A0A2S8GE28_9BACT|nr:sigma-54 dependent transcriptional regulator [Blastopirellula marina]PQO42718.1 sigma-54-dependent Fis family transcriptional regulator [Blastopirellula marina]PTL46484.1 sigma-54-dependent Fis family transcriptional regulator [Blastopirellula marina]
MTQEAQTQPQSESLDVQPDQFRVLVVDNDKAHAMTMAESLERIGFVCTVATSGPEGAEQITSQPFEIVVTDLVMNDIDGMEILRLAKEHRPNCEVIVVTGHATVSTAVAAMQHAALNFLEKPLTPDKLRAAALKAAETIQLKRQNSELMRRLDEKFGFEGLIYSSSKMGQVVQRLQRIAPTDASVLILGETGTGKEVVAQAIHQNSPRKKKPFVPLNCAELSEHLLESELFGHAKGAYTDAASERIGRLEYANGGTLFLDEIGDMPMATQVKLLRVLESSEITRVGENKPIKINVRLISATNCNLEDAIAAGTFRSDLYHRLRIVTVQLPPLRERPDDILPLFDHFLKMFAKKHDKKVRGIDRTVYQRCLEYDWPGNVRQLRNFAESMVVLDLDGTIGLDDLPPELIQDGDDLTPPAEPKPTVSANGELTSMVGQPISEVEKWLIAETLKSTGQNREEAAKLLGIGERTLYRKIKEYGLRGD